MGKYLPGAYRGLLYTNVCRDKKKKSLLNIVITCMALNVLAKPHFIAYNQKDRHALPVRIVAECYRAPRFVWTVRTNEDYTMAHEFGECPIFENLTD